MFFELIFGFIFLLCFYDYIKYRGRVKGPFRFPILGNIPQILISNHKYIHLALQKLGDKYGDLMFVKLGAKEMVIINTYKAAKEIMKKDELTARDLHEVVLIRTNQKLVGLALSDGEDSLTMRKYIQSSMNEFGYGKRLEWEEDLNFEGEELVKLLYNMSQENSGKIKIQNLFNLSSFNSVYKILTGERKPLDDLVLNDFNLVTKEIARCSSSSGSIGMLFPFTKLFYNGLKSAAVEIEKSKVIVSKIIQNFRDKGPITNPKCLIEKFIMDIENNLKNGGKNSILNEDQLQVGITDLFLGGIETTAGTLEWGLLHLLHNPIVQNKIHEELDSVIGKEGKISYSHKNLLPYTQATILETLRICPTFSLQLPRRTLNQFKYNGYIIDKDICVITNIYGIHHCKTSWGDPENFRPERFIDNITGEVIKKPPILTFGSGKRSCVAEHIAMDTLFFLFSSILRNFKISKVPNQQLPTLDPLTGFTLSTQPYEIILVKK